MQWYPLTPENRQRDRMDALDEIARVLRVMATAIASFWRTPCYNNGRKRFHTVSTISGCASAVGWMLSG